MYVCMYVTLLAQVHRRRGRGGAGGADPDGVRGLHERLRAAAAGQGAPLLARVPRQVCRQEAQGNVTRLISFYGNGLCLLTSGLLCCVGLKL